MKKIETIILTKNDLRDNSKNLLIEDINVSDFNISFDKLARMNYVIYLDTDQNILRILKSRYIIKKVLY